MNNEMNSAQKELARMIWNLGALKTKDHPTAVVRGDERGFLLKAHESNPSLPLSPFYLNLRTPDNPKPGPLTQEFVDLTAKTMRTMVDQFGVKYQYVVGIPNAGDPFAESHEWNWDWDGVGTLHLGKQVGAMDRKILGLEEAGPMVMKQRCLLVDDLISQAMTKIEAVEALRNDDMLVTDLVVLVDREQGGVTELARLGVVTHSVLSISQLLHFYHKEMCCMSDEVYAELMQYLGLQ